MGPDILSSVSAKLVDAGDLNELTAHVNGLVLDHDWAQLAALRSACRKAFERGKQLWPVSSYIEYRLCLEAPGPWAASMLESGEGRFHLGPLPEVAATRHTWAELAPHLHGTPEAAMAAHERVVRGEDLSGDKVALALPEVFDLPLCLQPWEPVYRVPVYREAGVEVLPPKLPPMAAMSAYQLPEALGRSEAFKPDNTCRALEELVSTWTEESNGRAEAVCSVGPALSAVSRLGARRALLAQLSPGEALAAMAWAAADGGAHGRRRGAAPGRHSAWLVLAALAGLEDRYPLPAGELGQVANEARWYRWGSGEPETGWSLRLAVEITGSSWAFSAQDDD